MDELPMVDFEELIDLNLSLPSVSHNSSQEPITDVLDKMCEAIDESNFKISMNNILKNNKKEDDEILPDDYIVNLDDFENLLATASLCNDGGTVTDDTLQIDDKKNGDDVVDLDEFENLLATAALCNDEMNSVTDDISQINVNDMVQMPDLDKFESISANTCLFIDDEDTTDTSINKVGNIQRVLSYEVPVDFENECANTTERDVVKKENITSAKKYTVHTISLESTATSNENENYIDLETIEFGVVNTVSNKLNSVEYENGFATVKAECEVETNITKDIVTFTINDCEVKYENAVVTSETDCKNTIDTLTEDSENKNTDSDDGYDSSDFEFISEQEASKAGIFTRIGKMTSNTQQSISRNAKNSVTQDNKQNTSVQSTSNNIYNRLGKNEASLSDYIKYSKYRYQRCYSRAASELHVIPEGERYLDMFRGEYAPVVVNNLYSLRNKRVLSAVAMAANFEELAYRDPGQVDENNEKYKDDADDCLKKIISTYPYQNRRKRRRH